MDKMNSTCKELDRSIILEKVMQSVSLLSSFHCPGNAVYEMMSSVLDQEIASIYENNGSHSVSIQGVADIVLPYHSMGNVTSLDLWRLDEIIMFAWYKANVGRYKKAIDIGGNIGLHSIFMSKMGIDVIVFEPDPNHIEILNKNLKLNECDNVQLVKGAVSGEAGKAEFIRVIDNTTSSHLVGAKGKSYGPFSKFMVDVFAIEPYLDGVQFMKIDAEGSEAAIIGSIPSAKLKRLEIMVEVGSVDGAAQILKAVNAAGCHIFSQKKGWQKVNSMEEMPTSYRDGSIFITGSNSMKW